jgi:predicted anti-sigma-YlaC factor YlaD
MNQSIHEYALSLGPCAEYEFDLFEQSEGTLAPEPAALLQQHLAHCARCRAYAAELAQLDATLAATLPKPALSSDFDARLAARIGELRRTPERSAALATESEEYQRRLSSLGRALDWHTALTAIAAASATGGVLYALVSISAEFTMSLHLQPPAIAALGMAIAVAASGVSLRRRARI